MRPSASAKTRRLRTFSASRSASASVSACVTPSSTSRPGPIAPVTAPSTVTLRPADALDERPHRSRSSAAACSGGTMQRFTPVPSSSPARCVRRGWISIRQQKCSAPLGAVRTHRFSGGLAPSRARRRRSASCSSAAPVGPSSSKRARGAPRREHEVERDARGVGRHQHGLVVDRDDPLAPADLLLHEVGEQVAAHRAHGVGAEALALAGDRGGDEVQRVELRVRVRERGAGLAALVDDQVPAGGVRRGRASARARSRRRARPARSDSSARVVTGSGALTITSCAPAAGWAVNRSG